MGSAITEKLNPPIIEGTLPAFCRDDDGTALLAVPFSMNKAISVGSISGFVAKIKTIQSNTYLSTLYCLDKTLALNDKVAYFTLTGDLLDRILPGQYLKVQIAYLSNDSTPQPGYFSTVGVVKYTTKPSVFVVGAAASADQEIPSFKRTYTGIYKQIPFADGGDTSEKEYEFIFNLYNSAGNLVQTSDWQLHNSATDITDTLDSLTESSDSWNFKSDLVPYQVYYIEYGVRTINGLVVYSHRYVTMDIEGVHPDMKANVVATNILDDGCIKLTLEPLAPENNHTRGSYVIVRTSEDSNYTLWEEIYRVSFFSSHLLTEWYFKDYTIEQGKNYKYGMQQYNDLNLYSTKLVSNVVRADFEDMFLYDGKQQLKIRFNPKVTSFKINKLEQKIDTIGSKFPYFVKNGRVEYREFPIAGLISYLEDDAYRFMSKTSLGLKDDYRQRGLLKDDENIGARVYYELPLPTTDLLDYNFYAERKFKMEVLEWLGNGKPKLFKSPSEGNYIVKLMNVSLSPEDKVSRMLHSFSATAYEVAENTYKNLELYNFIDSSIPNKEFFSYETVQLVDEHGYFLHGKINRHSIIGYIHMENMMPGTIILSGTDGAPDNRKEKWIIGATGSLTIDLENQKLDDIFISTETDNYGRYTHNYVGQVTYKYKSKVANTFNLVKDIRIHNEIQTFVSNQQINIFEHFIDNIKKEIFIFYYLKFYKKEIRNLWKTEDIYYLDAERTIPVEYFDQTVIYQVYDDNDDLIGNFFVKDDHHLDEQPTDNISFSFYVNGERFEEEPAITFSAGEYTSALVNNGYVCDCAYQVKIIDYEIESTDPVLKRLAAQYGTDSQRYLNELSRKIEELKEEMESEG